MLVELLKIHNTNNTSKGKGKDKWMGKWKYKQNWSWGWNGRMGLLIVRGIFRRGLEGLMSCMRLFGDLLAREVPIGKRNIG